jgi:hypothetical protein
MIKTLKVKLCLLIVLVATMVPVLTTPVQADSYEEKIKVSGELGYRNHLETGYDTDELQFSAFATTTHEDYSEIKLQISYGTPYRSGNIDRCNFFDHSMKILTKSEVDVIGNIRLSPTNSIRADKAHCIGINVSMIKKIKPTRINRNTTEEVDSQWRQLLWDPNKQYDNWLPSEGASVVSIGYDKGDDNYLRFHGIGRSNQSKLDYHTLRGFLYEKADGSLDDTYFDSTGVPRKVVEWSSTKKFKSKAKDYKLFVESITSYYKNGENEKNTFYESFTLFWSPNRHRIDMSDIVVEKTLKGDLHLVDKPLRDFPFKN